jgi:polysaccharide biosynthesis protein PslH
MESKRILFVGKKYLCDPSGGREMLSALNYQILKRMYSNNLFNFELASHHSDRPEYYGMRKVFYSEIDGISSSVLTELIKLIDQNNINQLFIDGSNLGLIAQTIKTRFPSITIYTFFHNVEAKFFFDAFLLNKSLRSLAVLTANYFAERKAALHSDHIICLTEVDSMILKKIYGKSANSISAMALNDELPQDALLSVSAPDISREKYVLFVGGLFYANEYGVRWFVQNVASKIKLKTYIVGRGFEVLREELETNENVRVLGGVDDLFDCYFYADYVVAPIFNGSGMKTKVAEALMFGKRILATDAALVGYNGLPDNAYHACNTKEEFIDALNHPNNPSDQNFDQNLRDIYQKKFSSTAAQLRLEKILQT